MVLLSQTIFFNFDARADLANPIEIINGGVMSFTSNTTANWYTFSLATNSTVWLIASDYLGYSVSYVYIYDESMVQVFKDTVDSDTISLSTGRYYLNITENSSGNISVYSPVLNPDPIPPVPTYLDGYNDGKQDGYDEGRQACIDDPASCGYLDQDNDGVPDFWDQCPGPRPGFQGTTRVVRLASQKQPPSRMLSSRMDQR